jgi:hypothetical protein
VRPDLDVNAWFAGRRDGTLAGIPSSANPLLSFVLAGRANNAPSFFAPDKNNFAPRLSVAWSPSYSGGPWRALFGDSGQSSFRAGVGVFFDRTGGSFPITADLNGAVGLSTFLMTPAATFSYDSSPRFSGLQNLTAIPVPAAPQAGFPSVLNSPGNTGFLVDSRLRTPYSTVFNLSFSRTLPGDITVEAAYVGRVAKDLLTLSDYAAPLINFRDPKSGQSWVDAAGVLADLFGRNTPVEQVPQIPFFENVFPSLATTGLSASQVVYGQVTGPDWTSLLYGLDLSGASIHGPYTFFQEQFAWLPTWTNLGQSSYHSIQLMVRRRFGNGFSADFNYTWAKTTDNGSSAESEGQRADQLPNAFDSRQFISPSSFDVRHQINLNFVADLPFGRSRRFSMPGPVLDRIVSDWRLSGLMRWRTGFPFPNLSGNGFAFPTNFFINGPPTLIPGVAVPRTQVTKDAPGGPNIFSDPAAAYDAFG